MLLSTDFPSIKNMQMPNNRNGVKVSYNYILGFPGGSKGKEPSCRGRSHRDTGSIPGLGRVPGIGNGNHFSENPMDRGAWWAAVHRVAKSRTQLK